MLPKPNENEADVYFIVRTLKDEEMITKYPDEQERVKACEVILNEVREKEKKSEPVAEIEWRAVLTDDLEMRVEGDDEASLLTGYAAKFNKWSEPLYWFREKIDPGAFADALKTSDVRALKNHDANLILGRSTSGTLRLDENKTGLKFEIDIPDTNTGRDIAKEVRRRDITGCSFSFTVDEDSWKYDAEDGLDERTIIKIGQLFDVGPVTWPAYPDTSVAARDVDTTVAKRCRDAFYESHKQEPGKDTREKEEQEQKEEPAKLDFETRHRIGCGYREAGRIIARNKSANV